jgi:hypothetical protein
VERGLVGFEDELGFGDVHHVGFDGCYSLRDELGFDGGDVRHRWRFDGVGDFDVYHGGRWGVDRLCFLTHSSTR